MTPNTSNTPTLNLNKPYPFLLFSSSISIHDPDGVDEELGKSVKLGDRYVKTIERKWVEREIRGKKIKSYYIRGSKEEPKSKSKQRSKECGNKNRSIRSRARCWCISCCSHLHGGESHQHNHQNNKQIHLHCFHLFNHPFWFFL